ncbi:MAG: hypothetical protein ACKVHE_32120 [Planctomycetales bacterium]
MAPSGGDLNAIKRSVGGPFVIGADSKIRSGVDHHVSDLGELKWMSVEIDAVQRLKNEYRNDDSVRTTWMKDAEEAATFLAMYAARAIDTAKQPAFDFLARFPDMGDIQTEWNSGGLLVVALEYEFVPALPELSAFADTRDRTMHMAVAKFCCTVLSEWHGGDRLKAAQRLRSCPTLDVANVHMRLSSEHRAWEDQLRLDALLNPRPNTPVSMDVSLRDVSALKADGDQDATTTGLPNGRGGNQGDSVGEVRLPSRQFWDEASKAQKAMMKLLLDSPSYRVRRKVLEATEGCFNVETPSVGTLQRALNRLNDKLTATANGWVIERSTNQDSLDAEVWLESPDPPKDSPGQK